MDLIIVAEESAEEIKRSVTLSNSDWAILAMCTEAYTETFRAKHSQIIATYVTRNQIPEAQAEAIRMNSLLAQLDKLTATIA